MKLRVATGDYEPTVSQCFVYGNESCPHPGIVPEFFQRLQKTALPDVEFELLCMSKYGTGHPNETDSIFWALRQGNEHNQRFTRQKLFLMAAIFRLSRHERHVLLFERGTYAILSLHFPNHRFASILCHDVIDCKPESHQSD